MKFYTIKNNSGLFIASWRMPGKSLSIGHIYMVSLIDNIEAIYVKEDIYQIEKKDMNEAQKALLVSARLRGFI